MFLHYASVPSILPRIMAVVYLTLETPAFLSHVPISLWRLEPEYRDVRLQDNHAMDLRRSRTVKKCHPLDVFSKSHLGIL